MPELRCLHDGRCECWLCSDLRSWWMDARVKAGLGESPPNVRVQVPTVEPPPSPRAPRRPSVKTARCIDCDRRVVYGPRCGTCAQLHRWRTYGRSGELRVVRDVMAPVGELTRAAAKSWGKR